MARSQYTINDLMKDQYLDANINKDFINVKKAALGTGTQGARNVIFGMQAFTQFNNEAITWALLPKTPWKQSGFRMRTGRGFTPGTGTSVADGGSFGTTITSDLREVEVSWKTTRIKFGVDLQFALNAGNDDDYTFEEEIKHKALDHIRDINSQLTANGTGAPVATDIETIDRIVSNQATAQADVGNEANYAVYDIDRNVSTDADSTVINFNGVALTTRAVRDLIDQVRTSSGKRPNVLLTRPDSAAELSEIFENQLRYDLRREDFTVNGDSTTGQDFLNRVGAVDGIPLLVDAQLTDFGGATLGHIYALNTEHISFATLLATQFFESNEDGMLDRDEMRRVGAYVTIGNVWCNMFSAHGKLMNFIANP